MVKMMMLHSSYAINLWFFYDHFTVNLLVMVILLLRIHLSTMVMMLLLPFVVSQVGVKSVILEVPIIHCSKRSYLQWTRQNARGNWHSPQVYTPLLTFFMCNLHSTTRPTM